MNLLTAVSSCWIINNPYVIHLNLASQQWREALLLVPSLVASPQGHKITPCIIKQYTQEDVVPISSADVMKLKAQLMIAPLWKSYSQANKTLG